jgi:hypothetical protein
MQPMTPYLTVNGVGCPDSAVRHASRQGSPVAVSIADQVDTMFRQAVCRMMRN